MTFPVGSDLLYALGFADKKNYFYAMLYTNFYNKVVYLQ